MLKTKRPKRGEHLSQEEKSNIDAWYMKSRKKSIPLLRVSVGTLEDIYTYQRGRCKLPELTLEEMALFPDSDGMEFGQWFDLIKPYFDIYEEG